MFNFFFKANLTGSGGRSSNGSNSRGSGSSGNVPGSTRPGRTDSVGRQEELKTVVSSPSVVKKSGDDVKAPVRIARSASVAQRAIDCSRPPTVAELERDIDYSALEELPPLPDVAPITNKQVKKMMIFNRMF